MPLLNDRYVERMARTRALVPEAHLKKMDEILRLTGGHLRIPTTAGTGRPLVVDCSDKANVSEVAGWHSPAKDSNGGVASADGVTEGHTPALWLRALASDCRCNPAPESQNQDTSQTKSVVGSREFRSMLHLVPTACSSTEQKLETVFDGGVYTGRPVGSCQGPV